VNVCLEIDSLNNFSSILDTLSLSPPLISALPPSTLNPVNHLAVLPLFLDPSSLSISCPEPRALVLIQTTSSSPPLLSLHHVRPYSSFTTHPKSHPIRSNLRFRFSTSLYLFPLSNSTSRTTKLSLNWIIGNRRR